MQTVRREKSQEKSVADLLLIVRWHKKGREKNGAGLLLRVRWDKERRE